MATTLPSSLSLADAARVARASGVEYAQRQRQPPTAASAIGPAVVNHVAGADPGAAGAAHGGDAGLDRASAGVYRGDAGADRAKAGLGRADAAEAERAAPKGSPEEEHADELRALAKRDAEVRAHEQAHAAAGGAFAGAPSYGYQRGPDGRSYAVSGEVPIDVSAIAGDPEATIQKMQQVKRAALAPRDPSHADRAIAATADAMIVAARREQMSEKTSGTDDSKNEGATAGAAARDAFSAFERRSAGAAAYSSANAP